MTPNQLKLHVSNGTSGKELRDRALESLEQAHREWIDGAMDAIVHLACHHESFTTDDVWAFTGDSPKEPRAMGAVMVKAAKAGLIERTNTTKNSIRAACHRRPVRIWKSLLYRAGLKVIKG